MTDDYFTRAAQPMDGNAQALIVAIMLTNNQKAVTITKETWQQAQDYKMSRVTGILGSDTVVELSQKPNANSN